MEKIKNPHDKIFKETMSDIETAKDFFRNYLPEELLKLIDLDNISVDKDSYIEKELGEYFSDILYKINLLGKESYIYFLFEHKSYNYKKITLQLLEYMIKIWNLKVKQRKALPIIIPIVIHHGKSKWNVGLNLSDTLEEVPEELKKYIPNFEYILYDLTRFEDKDIRGHVKLRIFLEILKYIFSEEELPIKLKEIFELSEELAKEDKEEEYFETLVKYILNAQEKLDLKDLADIARESSIERSERVMTAGERLLNQGVELGIQQGLQQGLQQGVIQGLLEGIQGMVEIKFGENSLWLMELIRKANSIDELEKIKNYIKKIDTVGELEKQLKM